MFEVSVERYARLASCVKDRAAGSNQIKALARTFRWKRMLGSGEYATIVDLAEREGIAPCYVTRDLRLTLLAPDTVKTILDGKHGPEVALGSVLEPFPLVWRLQREHTTLF